MPDQAAVVIGAGGPGHIGIQVLRAMCAARIVVVDISHASLALAAEHGADHLIKVDGGKVNAVLALTGGKGAEAVIDFVGEKGTTKKGLDMTHAMGSDYVVGYGEDIRLPTVDMVITRKNIIGNLVGTWAELTELMALADRGLVELVTKHYRLDQTNEALLDLHADRRDGECRSCPLRRSVPARDDRVPDQQTAYDVLLNASLWIGDQPLSGRGSCRISAGFRAGGGHRHLSRHRLLGGEDAAIYDGWRPPPPETPR